MRTNSAFRGHLFPHIVQQMVDGCRIIGVTERQRVGTSKLLPGKLPVLHPFTDLLNQIDRRNQVMVGHPFMIQDHIRLLPPSHHRDKGVIDKMQQDDVHLRIA